MTLPRFTAETSLYKTRSSYRGRCSALSLGRPGGRMVPQLVSCEDNCKVQGLACLGAAVVGCPPWAVPICVALCAGAFASCVDSCPSSGDGGNGGGPPPPPPCCPLGRSCRCGGRCVPGKGCVGGVCLGPREQCP
jgi:hypothetical protein